MSTTPTAQTIAPTHYPCRSQLYRRHISSGARFEEWMAPPSWPICRRRRRGASGNSSRTRRFIDTAEDRIQGHGRARLARGTRCTVTEFPKPGRAARGWQPDRPALLERVADPQRSEFGFHSARDTAGLDGASNRQRASTRCLAATVIAGLH